MTKKKSKKKKKTVKSKIDKSLQSRYENLKADHRQLMHLIGKVLNTALAVQIKDTEDWRALSEVFHRWV